MVYALLIIVLNLQRTLNDGNSSDGCIFCRLQYFSILSFKKRDEFIEKKGLFIFETSSYNSHLQSH